MLALRLAARELRGGVRGLGVVLLCLALGVAAIAGVGGLRAGVEQGLAENGRALLGGDVEVQTGAEPPPPALLDWLRARGARVSEITRMHSLLIAPSGQPELIDLKAVDAAWPLVGAPVLAPSVPLAQALAPAYGQFGLVADPLALDRLGLKPGNTARLGTALFRVAAAFKSEPDRLATPSLFGAPVVIAAAALPSTSLEMPGAIVTHAVRAAWADPRSGPAMVADLAAAFPDRGWRVRGPADANPGVARAVAQTALFMTLVGLTALLVGGVGVASGTRAWLEARARSLAILRCLGASSRLAFAVVAIQVAALALCGIAIGLAAGAAIPPLAAHWLAGRLPVPPRAGLHFGPLALATAYGVLTAACFALPPLARAMRIPGAALFRDGLIPEDVRPPVAVLAATVALGAALGGLAVWSSADRRFALGFCGAALLILVLFRLGGAALVRVAGAIRLPWPAPRLGLASLRRPGAPTPLMLTSIGLGLSTLAMVALVQGNIGRAILEEMPANAPSFYFLDIQPAQRARFEAIVRATPDVSDLEQVPSLRARVVAVNGVPAERVHAAPNTRWALRGDRGLTYAASPPPGTRLLAGRWWPADYAGPPLVSLDAEIAKGWGIGLGAAIRLNVLGRDLDLRVANLREVPWRQLGLNFVMIASPGLLSGAPHTYIATVRVGGPEQAGLLRRVSSALPNVTGISVTQILTAVAGLLGQMATALAAMGALTLAAGVLVLAGAVAAGRRRRVQEAVILKALGATRAQLRAAWLVEFGAIGLVAGAIAGGVGTAASWAVMRFVAGEDWVFLPGRLAGTLAGALALMLIFGYAGTASALRAKPAARLRNE
ncbi:MAG: FtsX-like permease family protein [Acetobacteraceae bacterium]|nr:FtsX-like permease family protein [Acetobacteraceae bacterium]